MKTFTAHALHDMADWHAGAAWEDRHDRKIYDFRVKVCDMLRFAAALAAAAPPASAAEIPVAYRFTLDGTTFCGATKAACIKALDGQHAEIEPLYAHPAAPPASAADAERYRFIRDRCMSDDIEIDAIPYEAAIAETSKDFDEAIDAAISEGTPK